MHHPSRPRAPALALLAAATVAAALLPHAARAEKSALRECTDSAWADYNECLMETDSYIFRKGCDYDFMMSYEKCHIVHWRETLGIN